MQHLPTLRLSHPGAGADAKDTTGDDIDFMRREIELVRAEQPPAAVDVFAPVRLADGSFARPVRVRWSNETQWEDRRTNTRLSNYSPSEQFGLIPMETY